MGSVRRTTTILEALEYVAAHPNGVDTIDTPVWELVGRSLYDIANKPDPKVRGSLARATKAQKILLDRMVGRRKPGSAPISGEAEGLDFHDLTMGQINV